MRIFNSFIICSSIACADFIRQTYRNFNPDLVSVLRGGLDSVIIKCDHFENFTDNLMNLKFFQVRNFSVNIYRKLKL